jgi:hypothetical protein
MYKVEVATEWGCEEEDRRNTKKSARKFVLAFVRPEI